jgi:hypothetical protein
MTLEGPAETMLRPTMARAKSPFARNLAGADGGVTEHTRLITQGEGFMAPLDSPLRSVPPGQDLA